MKIERVGSVKSVSARGGRVEEEWRGSGGVGSGGVGEWGRGSGVVACYPSTFPLCHSPIPPAAADRILPTHWQPH